MSISLLNTDLMQIWDGKRVRPMCFGVITFGDLIYLVMSPRNTKASHRRISLLESES